MKYHIPFWEDKVRQSIFVWGSPRGNHRGSRRRKVSVPAGKASVQTEAWHRPTLSLPTKWDLEPQLLCPGPRKMSATFSTSGSGPRLKWSDEGGRWMALSRMGQSQNHQMRCLIQPEAGCWQEGLSPPPSSCPSCGSFLPRCSPRAPMSQCQPGAWSHHSSNY